MTSTIWSDTTRETEHYADKPPIEHPITLSLFSGAGGLDIGFHAAGFRVVACIEIEKNCCKTLECNLGKNLDVHCQIINGDIGSLFQKIFLLSISILSLEALHAKAFLQSGEEQEALKAHGIERGSLFEHYCRFVKHFQPQGFLFENVRGILSSNNGKDWKQIIFTFADLGYQLSYRILDCADYGVPQHRERLIMVGTRIGLPSFKFPRPTHGPDSPGQIPYVGALQAITDLQNSDEPTYTYSGKYGNLLEENATWTKLPFLHSRNGLSEAKICLEIKVFRFLYKADLTQPVRTIVAKLGAFSGPFHWKNRKFTLEEFKRLQSFPDTYEFAGGLNSSLQQIGNSVPPLFAEQLAKAVLATSFCCAVKHTIN